MFEHIYKYMGTFGWDDFMHETGLTPDPSYIVDTPAYVFNTPADNFFYFVFKFSFPDI